MISVVLPDAGRADQLTHGTSLLGARDLARGRRVDLRAPPPLAVGATHHPGGPGPPLGRHRGRRGPLGGPRRCPGRNRADRLTRDTRPMTTLAALPSGLTSRALTRDDAPAVYAVMAAEQQRTLGRIDIEEADIVADWARPSHDLSTQTVGVFDGDHLVAYAEVVGHTRGDAAVHPDRHGRGSAPGSHTGCRTAPVPGPPGDRHAGAGRVTRRGLDARARLPRAVDLVGAADARRSGPSPAAAARRALDPRLPSPTTTGAPRTT